jgi:hypothetical protein
MRRGVGDLQNSSSAIGSARGCYPNMKNNSVWLLRQAKIDYPTTDVCPLLVSDSLSVAASRILANCQSLQASSPVDRATQLNFNYINSAEQSRSWEANIRIDGQHILLTFVEPADDLPFHVILSQLNSEHILKCHSFQVYFKLN